VSWPLLSVVVMGFLLGVRHATDPDHVVAVAAIVSRERSLRAALPIGVVWGVGHTATILLLGVGIILFGLVVPPRVGLGMELAVAVMLIGIGAASLRATRAPATHAHPHAHEHERASTGAARLVRPLVVGVVHGLAGSAAAALLVLGAVHDPRWAVAYLVVFGVGTVAGMLAITAALASPLALGVARSARLHRGVTVAAAMISVLFGAFLVYEITVVHGLFSAAPQWTPG
jgi:high-affinity nickel-transport protein